MRDRLVLLQEFSYQDTPSDFSVINLTDLVREFYEQNLPDMDVSGIHFLLHISPKEPLFVYGDRIKLISLLQNLVYNAVGFVPAEGKIELFLSPKDNNACIIVRDNGSGIAHENLPIYLNSSLPAVKAAKMAAWAFISPNPSQLNMEETFLLPPCLTAALPSLCRSLFS